MLPVKYNRLALRCTWDAQRLKGKTRLRTEERILLLLSAWRDLITPTVPEEKERSKRGPTLRPT